MAVVSELVIQDKVVVIPEPVAILFVWMLLGVHLLAQEWLPSSRQFSQCLFWEHPCPQASGGKDHQKEDEISYLSAI